MKNSQNIGEENVNKIKSGYSSKNPLLKFIFQKFFNKVWQNINDSGTNNILDVGCGEGVVINKLLEKNDKLYITGLDISYDNLKIAKHLNPDVEFLQGDVYKLPYKDDSFDLVMCTEVLEHLEEPEKAIKEIKRVSGKYCIISVPNEPLFRIGNILKFSYIMDLGNTPGHIQHWSKKRFGKLLNNYFKEVSINSSLGVWTFAFCKK